MLRTFIHGLCALLVGGGLVIGGTPLLRADQDKAAENALKDRIERRLQTDPTVKRYDIRVSVDDDEVKLEGMVATDAQKEAAERLARLPGIEDVDNDIEIDDDADQVLANRASKGLRRDGEPVTDAWITSKVRWFFVGDPALEGSDIEVDTDDRVVTLDGEVPSAAARARAIELALSVDGVVKVEDELEVK